MAALLYVDDTDLLHVSRSSSIPENVFCLEVQNATHYWASLLQATGGNLKPEKCYWYLLSYKFVQGRAVLKTKRELSAYTLQIPQPNSTNVVIQLKDPDEASEVLGVWSCPSSNGQAQLAHMLKKGRKWGTRVLNSTLQPAEVWQSFKTQALPSVTYGLIALMSTREALDESFASWYYHILPALGMNRHITREWRTLPTTYQGLGLPQMSIEKLSAMLHFLQKHWASQDSMGKLLRCMFELSQLEIGLSGNFLLRDYSLYGRLATHSWFRTLWEYAHYYRVQIELDGVTIDPVRERDQVLMEEAIKLLPIRQWISFNRARKFHKAYFLSQILLSDGMTVDPNKAQLKRVAQNESSMVFPLEKPTSQDLALWKDVICLLTSPKL
jgi:hypothetical protein